MFRRGLFCCVILLVVGFSVATDYTLFSRASGASATAVSKVELTTAAATAPDVISIQFSWTYGAAPNAANANEKALTICCVESLKESTDPLAAFLKDKCFGVTLQDADGTAANPIAAAATGKVSIAQGVKSGTVLYKFREE